MPLVLVLSSPPWLDTVTMRGQHCSMEKDEWITLLGLVAGTLTTLSFLPQLLKAWKSRSTHDISFGMLAIFSAGLVLWIVYGVIVADAPVIVANSVTLVLVGLILAFKLRYR